MEIINTIIAVIAAVGSLIVIVGTVVWAVGEIKTTTKTLAIEINHLGDRIKQMSDSFDDHEERLRAVEKKTV